MNTNSKAMKKDDKDDSFCTEDTTTYDETTLNTQSKEYDENGKLIVVDPLTRLFQSYHEQHRKVTFILCNDTNNDNEEITLSSSSSNHRNPTALSDIGTTMNIISSNKNISGNNSKKKKKNSNNNKTNDTNSKKGRKLVRWLPFRKIMVKQRAMNKKSSSTNKGIATITTTSTNTNSNNNKMKQKKNKYALSEEYGVLELLETTSLLSMMSECQEEQDLCLGYSKNNGVRNNDQSPSSIRKNIEKEMNHDDYNNNNLFKIDDELNELLKEGELQSTQLEYSKAISTYLKASDFIKRKYLEFNNSELLQQEQQHSTTNANSNYSNTKKYSYEQHPVHGCIVKRLNDIHHAVSLTRLSTQVLKMGLEEENLNDSNLKALKYYSVAYRMRRSLLGDSHISLAIILFMIARVQAKRQDYTESLLIYKLCLNLLREQRKQKKRNRKANNSSTCSTSGTTVMNSRLPSICLQPNGDHANERTLFFDPPVLQVLLRDIGAVYEKRTDYDKALEYYNESLHIQFGSAKNFLNIPTSGASISTSTSRGSVLNELLFDHTSTCYKENGSNQDASQFEEQSMEISIKGSTYSNVYNYAVKKDDVDSAMTLHSIGQIHRRLKQYSLALQAYNRALYCVKRTMGPKHPNVAAMLANIGNLYKEKGDMDMAFRIYQKVLRIEMSTLGPNHPELAVTLNNIAAIECSRGKYKEALGLLNRVYTIQKIGNSPSTNFKKSSSSSSINTTNPSLAVTLSSIGDIHEKLGNVDDAITSYEDAVRVYIQYFQNAESIEIGKLLHKIAILHHEKLNDLLKAESFMSRAVEVFQRIHKHQSSIQQHLLLDENNNNSVDYSSNDDDDDVPECDADVAFTLLKKAMNYYADIKAAIAVSRSDAWSVSSSESVGYSSV